MNGLGMRIGKNITRIAEYDILGYQIPDHTEEILKNGVNEHTHDVHKCKAGYITEKSHLSTY